LGTTILNLPAFSIFSKVETQKGYQIKESVNVQAARAVIQSLSGVIIVMSEFDHLIATICSSTANVQSRSSAERRLLELLSSADNLVQYLPALFTANATVTFFIGIGFQRLVWRHWHRIDDARKEQMISTLTSVLQNRLDLPSFAKSKLEQVLAAICVCNLSLQPALSMVVSPDQPGFFGGLSTIETVIEFCLSDDPKIDPTARVTLMETITTLVVPLTNLACSTCVSALQSTQSEDHYKAMVLALDLLKIIVLKLPIGVHISMNVLELLFSIAELGAAAKTHTTAYQSTALSAIEILTEIMYKRYIPTGNDINLSSMGNIVKNDQGVKILMILVSKTIELLKRFR
jgi:hypothetical protein